MRYIQEESYEDIAAHIGKTPHQTRALCSKALIRLRDIMKTDNKQISVKEI